MQTAKERQTTRPSNVSPKSSRPTASPSKCLATRQLQQKQPSGRKPGSFKVYQAPSSHPPYKIANRGQQMRLQTLGDQPFSPFNDDYETPKFNIEKEFKFGAEDKKKQDFFTFGLAKKTVGKEIVLTRSKGKQNSALGGGLIMPKDYKEGAVHHSQKLSYKGGSPHGNINTTSNRNLNTTLKTKDSVSPRKKMV